jgi:hypothetical protein
MVVALRSTGDTEDSDSDVAIGVGSAFLVSGAGVGFVLAVRLGMSSGSAGSLARPASRLTGTGFGLGVLGFCARIGLNDDL